MRAKLTAVLVLTLGLALTGCTRGKKDNPSSSVPAQPVGHAGVKDVPAGLAAEVAAQGVVDKGTGCQTHNYAFKAGEDQTLTFAFKLPPGSGDNVEFKIDGDVNNLERSTGMQLSVGSVTYETYPVPAWNIDCTAAFSELEESDQQKPILITAPGLNIAFDSEGNGVVAASSTAQNAELTEDAIRAKIGRQIRLGDRSFNYELSEGSIDGFIALVDLSVATPGESSIEFLDRQIAIIGDSKYRMVLTATKNRKEPFYWMSGPDDRSECAE